MTPLDSDLNHRVSANTPTRDYAVNPYVHDFERDETLYDVAYLKDGSLEVRGLKRRNFPSSIVSSHANRLLNKGIITDFNCFYSGIRCWKPTFDVNKHRLGLHFALTKDHAVPIRNADKLGLPSSHLVMCSGYMNHKLGHFPLALKLWIRRKLVNETYDRLLRTQTTIAQLRSALIRFNDMFIDENGLYLYQPWTYIEGTDPSSANHFYNKLIEVESEYLAIRGLHDAYSWLESYDPSWIENMRVR